MVSIQGVLEFTNLIVILFFSISVIETWALLAHHYDSMNCIVSLINFSNLLLLSYLKFEPRSIDRIILLNNNFYILTGIVHFYGGMLMLGLSTFSMFLGIMSILSGISNGLFVIFNLEDKISPINFEHMHPTPNLSESTDTIMSGEI
jgi:hypothetical protein